MTSEDILEICERAGAVGAVTHAEFANFVIVLSRSKKVDNEWVNIENCYMPVEGKVAMARADHARQEKKMFVQPLTVLVNTEQSLTVQVVIQSEIYGTSVGTATSRLGKGTNAEKEQPYEVAETSAIGRALAGFGYGILPGSGLASAEDMERVDGVERKAAGKVFSMSANQRNTVISLYRELHGGTEVETLAGLDAMWMATWKKKFVEALSPEASSVIGKLMERKKEGKAAENGNKPKTHWLDDPTNRAKFWAEVGKIQVTGTKLDEAVVRQILGVEKMHAYAGTANEALHAIQQFAATANKAAEKS